jgi:hypothetical protein
MASQRRHSQTHRQIFSGVHLGRSRFWVDENARGQRGGGRYGHQCEKGCHDFVVLGPLAQKFVCADYSSEDRIFRLITLVSDDSSIQTCRILEMDECFLQPLPCNQRHQYRGHARTHSARTVPPWRQARK